MNRRNGGHRRFRLGQLVATPAALRTLAFHNLTPLPFVVRHGRGDWGDMTADDKRANDMALYNGGRIFSAYNLPGGTDKLWVITEADRSSTCVLLPEDY